MVTIYSKTGCTFCAKAKTLLEFFEIEYEEIRIDENAKARTFVVNEGHRSVPQLYVGDRLLVDGGFEGLNELNKEEILTRIDKINGNN